MLCCKPVQNLFSGGMSNDLRSMNFVGLACQGMDIVFRFIIEYSSLRDIGP
jgi:hypothetical protein